MSQDLATIATQIPAHLRKYQGSTNDEFMGGVGSTCPLAFLSVRGKEFRLRKSGQEVSTRQREIEVVLVAARNTMSKRLFGGKYESGTTDAPICSSRDAVTPDVSDPVSPKCAICPKNEFGSAENSQGKACGDYKRVIVWPVGLTQEPLILDVSHSSIKAPKGQRTTDLMMGDYLSLLAKHGMDPTTVVTKIGFTDAEYPQMCFNFSRFTTEEEFAKVLEFRAHEDVETVLHNEVHEGSDKIKEVPATEKQEGKGIDFAQLAKEQEADKEPTPEPDIPAFEGTTVLKDDQGDLKIAEDEATYQALYAKGYRPVNIGKQTEGPKPTPEPEKAKPAEDQKSPEPDDGGDLLSMVTKMLS